MYSVHHSTSYRTVHHQATCNMLEDSEIKLGGFTFKGWYIAAAVPVFSAISGAIYFGYDTVNRFYDTEENVQVILDKADSFDTTANSLNSRIQTLEQAIQDNDVRGLAQKLSSISTNMQTILEQQKTLLDLRSKIDKSTTITDGLGDKLDTYEQEIEDLWKAYDELYANPLGN